VVKEISLSHSISGNIETRLENLNKAAKIGRYMLYVSIIPYIFGLIFMFSPFFAYFILWQPILVFLGLIIYEIGTYNESSTSTQMKNIIISALGGIGENAKEAIPSLVNVLKIPEQEEEYIDSFINKTKRGFKAFIDDPISQRASMRVEAARALGKIGINSEEALHALEDALNDPKPKVRREAALSLGKLGESAKRAIPFLLNSLKDNNPDVRWRSSEALGKLGENTEEIISGLSNLVHDECDYVCESALNALDTLTEEE